MQSFVIFLNAVLMYKQRSMYKAICLFLIPDFEV